MLAAGKSSIELNEKSGLSNGVLTEDAASLSHIRDRVRELRRVPARDLVPNPEKLAQTSQDARGCPARTAERNRLCRRLARPGITRRTTNADRWPSAS